MKTILAKTAGFCMGVKRAMDTVLRATEQDGGKLYTHGPLIHNKHVIEMLKRKGVSVTDEADVPEGARVVLRAHGVPETVKNRISECGAGVIDATCPHVLSSQRVIDKYSSQGYSVVIIGDSDHAEIKGLESYARGTYEIIATREQVEDLSLPEPVLVVGQTTFNQESYDDICDRLREKFTDIKVINSICSSTENRQNEIRELAEHVDAIVVVGDRLSANTVRLYQIAREIGSIAFHVETASDLDMAALENHNIIGVTAGASTPSWIVNEVIQRIEQHGPKSFLEKTINRIARWGIASNFYASLCAAAITFAASRLQGLREWRWQYLFISFSYVFSVYVIARIFHAGSELINPSFRTSFLRDKRRLFMVLASLFAVAGILISISLGIRVLSVTIGAYLLGGTYIMQRRSSQGGRILSFLSGVPASKDFITALAWSMVAVGIPLIHEGGYFTRNSVAAFLFVFLIAFIRAATFDFSDIEGDRLVGEDTLPVYFGRKKAGLILKGCILFLGVMLLTLPSGSSVFLGRCLSVVALYLIVVHWYLERGGLHDEVTTEIAIDSAFIVAGALGGISYLLM